MSALAAQVRAELGLSLRQGEQLLVGLGIPVALLVFFSTVEVLPLPDGTADAVTFLAPGILALAVMSTAMVSLGIATGFERQYGVLRRLGTTPLGRGRLVAAKAALVLVLELIQFAVLIPVALLLGWSPVASGGLALIGVLAGTTAFAGLGLLLAGTLRGTLVLAVDNALYLVLLLLGGIVFPLDRLPDGAAAVARLLPSAALAEVLRGTLSGVAVSGGAWAVLAFWAVAAPAAAAALFRWE